MRIGLNGSQACCAARYSDISVANAECYLEFFVLRYAAQRFLWVAAMRFRAAGLIVRFPSWTLGEGLDCAGVYCRSCFPISAI